MSDVIDRPILEKEVASLSRLRIIDCDMHPSIHAHADIEQFMPKRWQEHLRTYGSHLRHAFSETLSHPRMSPDASRIDAYPQLLVSQTNGTTTGYPGYSEDPVNTATGNFVHERPLLSYPDYAAQLGTLVVRRASVLTWRSTAGGISVASDALGQDPRSATVRNLTGVPASA